MGLAYMDMEMEMKERVKRCHDPKSEALRSQ